MGELVGLNWLGGLGHLGLSLFEVVGWFELVGRVGLSWLSCLMRNRSDDITRMHDVHSRTCARTPASVERASTAAPPSSTSHFTRGRWP